MSGLTVEQALAEFESDFRKWYVEFHVSIFFQGDRKYRVRIANDWLNAPTLNSLMQKARAWKEQSHK